MSLANGTKATATAAAVAVAIGLTVILYSITHGNLPHSIGGLGLTVLGLTVLVLINIRQWITDTSAERALLAAAQREAQNQKNVYITAQAALENEQGRLAQDLAAERAALDARLAAEREALRDEFEERRATLQAETMEATVMMLRGDGFAPSTTGQLIQFPKQHPQQERHRSREHGVVGP